MDKSIKTNILLTGASGAVGSKVLEQLSHNLEAYNVSILAKKDRLSQKILRPYKKYFQIFWGDIRDKTFVERCCQNQEVVIHLAAIIPPLADDKPELAYTVNVEGTRTLIEALEAVSPQAFFLYSSSVSVYGDRLNNPQIYVNDPLQASISDDYAETKIEAEYIIQSSKLSWSIFRLSAIFGIKNHKPSKLLFHMPLATPIEFTTPDDTARAFVNAITKQDLINQTIYNLGGGKDCRIIYKDFLQKSFKIYGLGKLKFPDNSFAEHNFHCGYYADGDTLEEILAFRKDTTESYFYKLQASVSIGQKRITQLITPLIQNQLTRQSEPLHAFKSKNTVLLKRFFKEDTI